MLDALLSWDGWTVTQLPAEQAAIFRLEGVPPSEEFLFIQESEALEILFCRKGGLFLEWAGHRRLSLSTDQVLFLPVRTEAYRGRFASEPCSDGSENRMVDPACHALRPGRVHLPRLE